MSPVGLSFEDLKSRTKELCFEELLHQHELLIVRFKALEKNLTETQDSWTQKLDEAIKTIEERISKTDEALHRVEHSKINQTNVQVGKLAKRIHNVEKRQRLELDQEEEGLLRKQNDIEHRIKRLRTKKVACQTRH